MGGQAGAAGRGMSMGYPQRCCRAFPGQAEQMSQVRRFLACVLDGCPAAGTVILLANEVATNAVQYGTGTGDDGRIMVWVSVRKGESVRIAVRDEGGPWAGQDRTYRTPEHGNGLFMVDAEAEEWGMVRNARGRTVWFRCAWAAA